jgi:formate dehydrogenase gamma subunit
MWPPRSVPGLTLLPAVILIFSNTVLGQSDCADCHDVNPDAFAETVHGFMDCGDCHAGRDTVPHDEEAGPVDCAMCHDDVVERYGESVHGLTRVKGETEAPDCAACHGRVHALQPASEAESPVNHRNLAETCGTCHANPDLVDKFGIHFVRPLEAYRDSVHAAGVENGDAAPTCNDCHDNHAIFPANDSRSTVFHQTVPETCGRCHGKIADIYARSVHGKDAAEGVREAPVCTDCHGEHRILSPRERGSPVYASNIPKMTCGRCHADLRLAEKFDFPPEQLPAYEDSYHGLANQLGSVVVANCASCHGVHDILPSSDPASAVNPDNLPETCGKCHPGAGENFARGKIHLNGGEESSGPGAYWVGIVRMIYLPLIIFTIGGMLLHNGTDFWRRVRTPEHHSGGGRQFTRLELGHRLQHAVLLVSFLGLVVTGFALKYPNAWWVRFLHIGEETRSTLHRIAGAAMVALALYHAVWLVGARSGRRELRALIPQRRDIYDALGQLGYNLGLRETPPRCARFRYEEKMEYWALVWGTIVMAVTGGILWFENWTLKILPKWSLDVAEAIHFYEAWLAFLAIVVWHWYFVIFRPGIYPMNWSWLTGKVSEDYMREEHWEEWESLSAAASGADDPAESNDGPVRVARR